jgi:isochorismate synthase
MSDLEIPLTDNYAIFRLPEERSCTLMGLQHGNPCVVRSVAELSGREGFVMAPFAPDEASPILLMEPDHVHTFLPPTTVDEANGDWHDEPDYAKERYHTDFANFHAQIMDGKFQKLVLSRSLRITFNDVVKPLELFFKACNLYPHQFIALISFKQAGNWLMATPEVLLQGDGSQWQTMALAGTQKLSQGPDGARDLQSVKWSEKNLIEQQYVTTYITEILERYSDDVSRKGPYTTMAAQLLHLRTDFHFRLHDTSHLGDLLNDLFPTPAVCGVPKEPARRFILQNESVDRKYYSGFCGPLSPKGPTHLFVSLRCMQLSSHQATLYAGGGLLRDSDEVSEWNETEAKLLTMKRLFDLPAGPAHQVANALGKATDTP